MGRGLNLFGQGFGDFPKQKGGEKVGEFHNILAGLSPPQPSNTKFRNASLLVTSKADTKLLSLQEHCLAKERNLEISTRYVLRTPTLPAALSQSEIIDSKISLLADTKVSEMPFSKIAFLARVSMMG
ncbi:unnamed protein product [Meganyctiphanes norvegica]|uniref:Uncharacterized protein n=1 Tax=Meganyctiphanes norvegica TaxID=48144 RepID=A0AAV2R2L6_MEGNR